MKNLLIVSTNLIFFSPPSKKFPKFLDEMANLEVLELKYCEKLRFWLVL